MKNHTKSPTVIVLLLLVALSSPCLVGRGMFLDGTYYAAIAKNLAFKSGSFWHLSFSQTLDKRFVSHMPLGIFLESLFFKALGDHFWTEKIYSLFNVLIIGILTSKLWSILTQEKSLTWLPLLVWISFPLTIWSATNNVLENTMAVFDLLSIILFLSAHSKASVFLSALGGLSVFAAFLSKGPQGLFPLFLPVIMFLVSDDKQNLVKLSVTFYLSFVTAFVLVFGLSHDAQNFLVSYIQTQILGSLTKTPFNLKIIMIKYLLNQTLLPLGLTAVLFLFSKPKLSRNDKKVLLINILIIAAGISPFAFSSKQRNFYLIPLLPYAAIIFSVVFKQYVTEVSHFCKQLKLKTLSMILSITAILFSLIFLFGKDCRDQTLLKDTDIIARIANKHNLICVSEKANANWQLKAYLSRFYNISLTQSDTCEFFISYKYEKLPEGYEKIDSKLTYNLEISRRTK